MNSAEHKSAGAGADTPSMLPSGVSITALSGADANAQALPFLLYCPDIDGKGLTSSQQHPAWAQAFDMHALALDPDCRASFHELAEAAGSWLRRQLAGVPPERPVYLLGEGWGAVLALQLAWDCRKVVNRLILVNPATSFAPDTPLGRLAELLERLPPQLLALRPPPLPAQLQGLTLPGLPGLPGLPLPPLPAVPPPSLSLALAPMLGTSPQALARQVLGGLSSQQPQEAAQALGRALGQVEALTSSLPPAAFQHRLKMLEQGVKQVVPRLGRIPQRCLVLAGGEDVLLGSAEEAERLEEKLQRGFKKVLPEAGHALLNEPGGQLLPLLRELGFYTTRRVFSSRVKPGADMNAFGGAGPVEIPNPQEVARYASSWTARIRQLDSPVFMSTLPDGRRVLGLEGLPLRARPGQVVEDAPAAAHAPEQEHAHAQAHADQSTAAAAPSSSSGHASGGSGAAGGHEAHGGSNASGADAAAAAAAAATRRLESLAAEAAAAGHEGPLLFVGNHQLYAFDMSVMVEEVLLKRGILMRGLAHPGLFASGRGDDSNDDGGSGSSSEPAGSDGKQQQQQQHSNGGSSSSVSASGRTIQEESKDGAKEGEGKDQKGKEKKGSGDEALPPAFMGNMFQTFGAVRVTPTAMFKLLAAGEAVLLYPGGVREGFKRRNEKYELFWPQRSEFVRMAARFGATIIPVSAVGLEDSLALVLDSDDIRNSPLWSERAREQAAAAPRARVGVAAEAGLDETFIPPLIAPAVPSRWYFLFGRPVATTPDMYRDRAACDQVYAEVKGQVEEGIDYLLRKRQTDPYRDFLGRMLYEQNPPFGPRRVAPTFEP
ncbi:hypothetical protein HYH02_013188 [Chlamydomonas schloesseri]|uniref:Phospholipid/glycerol acyltransferase domain-containing protein n=1 Tax=Chlamydomonas schloesseri TaxID=2026947 RepID=A0A835SUV5_9CHLO|nr:hypothetical protein HYH02_013188 [Chlamydomonas schloesseri]|eukprot:KAG2431972.1 hypothetical protein HYH02_013188 [Chlamydomonas schloesseri]